LLLLLLLLLWQRRWLAPLWPLTLFIAIPLKVGHEADDASGWAGVGWGWGGFIS